MPAHSSGDRFPKGVVGTGSSSPLAQLTNICGRRREARVTGKARVAGVARIPRVARIPGVAAMTSIQHPIESVLRKDGPQIVTLCVNHIPVFPRKPSDPLAIGVEDVFLLPKRDPSAGRVEQVLYRSAGLRRSMCHDHLPSRPSGPKLPRKPAPSQRIFADLAAAPQLTILPRLGSTTAGSPSSSTASLKRRSSFSSRSR